MAKTKPASRKTRKPTRPPGDAARAVLRSGQTAAEGLHMAISKVLGIMRNAALTTSDTDAIQRLRLVNGHRHAVRRAWEGFTVAMAQVSQAEAQLG